MMTEEERAALNNSAAVLRTAGTRCEEAIENALSLSRVAL